MKKIILLLAMLMLWLPRFVLAHAQDEVIGFSHHSMMPGAGLFSYGGWLAWPLMLIIWILIISGIIWLIKIISSPKGDNKDAIDELKSRLAKGEIDKEEFEKIKKEINK